MSGLGGTELLMILVMLVFWFVILVVPAAMICRRIGYSPALGLLVAIPVVNVVLLWYVALARWPSADANESS